MQSVSNYFTTFIIVSKTGRTIKGQPEPNRQFYSELKRTWQLFFKIKWHLHLSFGRKVIKMKGDRGFHLIEMKRPNLANVIYPALDSLSLCVTGSEWLHFHSSARRGLENDCCITTACYASRWVTFSHPYFVNTPLLLIRFMIYIWFWSPQENFIALLLNSPRIAGPSFCNIVPFEMWQKIF